MATKQKKTPTAPLIQKFSLPKEEKKEAILYARCKPSTKTFFEERADQEEVTLGELMDGLAEKFKSGAAIKL